MIESKKHLEYPFQIERGRKLAAEPVKVAYIGRRGRS